jgi:hypothetical protein
MGDRNRFEGRKLRIQMTSFPSIFRRRIPSAENRENSLRHCEHVPAHYVSRCCMRASSLTFLFLMAIGSVAGQAAEPAGLLDTLISSSPFGQMKGGVAGDAPNQPLEFRGVIEEGGGWVFSIYDTTSRHSRWVGLNAASDDFVVKEYDAIHQTVSVDQHGRTLSLSLKSAPKIAQAGNQMVMRPSQPNMIPGMPGPVGPGMQPGSPADAQRLQQIAQEIERRRALRRQAAQGQSQTFPVQPPRPGQFSMPLPANGSGPIPTPAQAPR